MSGEMSTTWSTAHDRAAEAARDRAVALGLLDRPGADQALAAWRADPEGRGFVGWLALKGRLRADDAARLLEDPGPSSAAVQPGDRLSGYVLEEKLGQGGMGVVWAARSEAGERVVVKLLAPKHAANPAWRARFAREGLLAGQVAHPNVVRVHAVDVEGPLPHLVMELVEGMDLQELVEAEGRLEPLEATRLARDVARGLAAAHALGVIHRDVKPGNVRLRRDGVVKLLDFGLARGLEVDEGLSLAGQVMGTPHYMAPEQWGDHRPDARADVYSLGATLYHLVTGSVPFPGDQPMAICRRTLEGDFPRPRALAPEVPPDLELVILRMMSLDRRARYQTAAAAADDLDAVLAGQPVHVPALLQADGARHPLLPGTSFTIGREPDCDIRLEHPSVAPRHARVELGPAGFGIVDLGGGCLVDGSPVARAQLKPGDQLRLGEVELRFEDAGVAPAAAASRAAAPQLRVRHLPQPFVEALAARRDRRTLVAQLELLPRAVLARQVESSRALLRRLFADGELAEDVGSRLEARLRARRAAAIEGLFRATHENLEDDEAEWLAWWDEAAPGLPPQVAPACPHRRSRLLVEGDGAPREVDLGRRCIHALGRGVDNDVRLVDPSVSRHHATLLRLDRLLVARDEGSRFGTHLDGATVRLAFLLPGQRLTLGRVSLVLEQDDVDADPPRGPDGELGVASELFDALAERAHPSTALGLARIIEAGERPARVSRLAAELHADPARASDLAGAVALTYAERAATAARLLPRAAPGLAPADPTAMAAEVERRRHDLGPQLVPYGWLP